MKTMKFIFLLLVLSAYSCENNKENENLKEKLYGMWEEIAPYNDGICDTIAFTRANTIDLYFPIGGWTYEISQKKEIIFSNLHDQTFTCNFSLDKDKLIIFNFIDHGLTQNVKNITFIKIKDL